MIRQGARGLPQGQLSVAAALLTTVGLLVCGCTVYDPVPPYGPTPSTFDRAWNAALGAAQDEGVSMLVEDRSHGVITGSRGAQEVTIRVRTQADGSVREELSARGPQGADQVLAERLSRAYDRRMGR
jgi:hypothetical protein